MHLKDMFKNNIHSFPLYVTFHINEKLSNDLLKTVLISKSQVVRLRRDTDRLLAALPKIFKLSERQTTVQGR